MKKIIYVSLLVLACSPVSSGKHRARGAVSRKLVEVSAGASSKEEVSEHAEKLSSVGTRTLNGTWVEKGNFEFDTLPESVKMSPFILKNPALLSRALILYSHGLPKGDMRWVDSFVSDEDMNCDRVRRMKVLAEAVMEDVLSNNLNMLVSIYKYDVSRSYAEKPFNMLIDFLRKLANINNAPEDAWFKDMINFEVDVLQAEFKARRDSHALHDAISFLKMALAEEKVKYDEATEELTFSGKSALSKKATSFLIKRHAQLYKNFQSLMANIIGAYTSSATLMEAAKRDEDRKEKERIAGICAEVERRKKNKLAENLARASKAAADAERVEESKSLREQVRFPIFKKQLEDLVVRKIRAQVIKKERYIRRQERIGAAKEHAAVIKRQNYDLLAKGDLEEKMRRELEDENKIIDAMLALDSEAFASFLSAPLLGSEKLGQEKSLYSRLFGALPLPDVEGDGEFEASLMAWDEKTEVFGGGEFVSGSATAFARPARASNSLLEDSSSSSETCVCGAGAAY